MPGILHVLIKILVEKGPSVLVVDADGVVLDIFSLAHHFSFLSPFLCEMARCRLKYCLKQPLNPKQPAKNMFTLDA